jgi:addiction module HigA family antidote
MDHLPPITPGELLRKEFLDPMAITAYELAKEIDVPQTWINDILKDTQTILANSDQRLCRFLGLSEGY